MPSRLMSRIRKHVLVGMLVILFLGISLFLSYQRGIRASQVTEALSSQERNDLKAFCQYLLKNTEFGYTLIGTKPMTLLSPACPDKCMIIPSRELFLRGVTILKKILSHHKTKNFTFIFFEEDKEFICIFFVNNKLFARTILDNKTHFEHLLTQAHDPEELLKKVPKNGDFFQIINHRTALLGICLGYGANNSLLLERKTKIQHWLHRPTLLKRQSSHLKSLLVPSSGFSFLEQELHRVEKLIKRSTTRLCSELSYVQLPLFFCDKNDPETLSILNAYRNEQKEIRKMLASDDIVERVFGKILEE